MRKKLLLSFALLLIGLSVQAVPAKPGLKKTVTLSDGSTVELTLRGDEHFSFYTDEKGTPYQLNNGRLVKRTLQEISEQWNSRKEQRMKVMQASKSHRAHRAGKPSNATTGKHRGLVILIQFPDMPFVTKNANEVFTRFFNGEDYHENGMTGSVRDYFLQQSYDQLDIDFDVVGPYTTVNEMAYYGAPVWNDNGNLESHDIHAPLMVAEAVEYASVDVDFTNYDWDKDGEVDQVFVIFAGYAEAQGGNENTIWPHEWVLAAEDRVKTFNGVKINTYGCASELRGSSGTEVDGVGTACHEFSHCLGLPDMYDTSDEGSNYAMAFWDVMCSGSYNDNSCTPAGYTSYERWFSGWMEPTEIKEMTRVTDMLPLAVKGSQAYILYNEKNRNEYYLLENRQPVGFDAGLYGHGLLVLHVDYNENAWVTNTVNQVAGHERMTIIPADNNTTMSVTGLQGDPFPGASGNTSLTNYTEPAATLFNANVDGTKLMSKPIDNITEDSENMTVSFVVCRPEIGVPELGDATGVAADKSFTAKWSAVSGALGYELELTTMDRASSDPVEALQWKCDFSKCYSEKTGYTDISSKMSSYGLPGWSGTKLFTTPNKLRLGTSSSLGSLKSPTWEVPSSQDLTIVMGADKVVNEVSGTISITYGNNGDKIADCPTQSAEFTVSSNTKQVFVFKDVRKDLFWMEITPKDQMYINYLAIYDGEWTAEQLGISNASRALHRVSSVAYYTSDTNSYTFTDLDVTKRYIYRIRTLGEENTYSQWSDEKTFDFNTTSIQSVLNPSNSPAHFFDLQGREASGSTKGLLIRRQGNEVKKVMVK